MTKLVAEDGCEITGTLDRILATALIQGVRKTEDGVDFDWVGETEVDWDSQRTVTRKGKRLFVCECGEHWTEDQLKVQPEEV